MSKFNRIICTYEDFTVFECDFRSLSSSWLTDTAVNFGAVWLQNNTIGKVDNVCLVYAFMCELLKHSGSDSETESLLKLAEATPEKWCFFILNDNPDPTVVSGGCHWTLLVHDPVQHVLWQLDPMTDSKPLHCTAFFHKVNSFFKHTYKVLPCPKMSVNGSCGVYVLEYLHCIFRYLKTGGTTIHDVDFSAIDDDFARERRRFYCNLLNKLAVEQGREVCNL